MTQPDDRWDKALMSLEDACSTDQYIEGSEAFEELLALGARLGWLTQEADGRYRSTIFDADDRPDETGK